MPSETRVAFDRRVAVVHTLHLEDYTEEEISSSWHSRDEYAMIKEETLFEALHMQQEDHEARPQDEQPHRRLPPRRRDSSKCLNLGACRLGLSEFTPIEVEKKRQRRRQAFDAVFYEQDLQVASNLHDEDRIAHVYSLATSESQQVAFERGLNLHIRIGLGAEFSGEAEDMRTVAKKTSLVTHQNVADSNRSRSNSPKLTIRRRAQ